MPLILGAFEQASNGPVDCYLTTAISNYRLPEVNYVEARWNRRTWRETNRVRNSLSRLHVEPYDAMYELDKDGKKVLGPFKKVLQAITAIETDLIASLKTNKDSIADSASNLRWMVVDIIRQQIRLMDRDVRVDAKHQLKKMIKSVFSMRYKNYDRLPFRTNSHQNNEVWNGTDYANGFHKAGFLSKGDATTKAEYLSITSLQEKLNISIAETSMQRIGEVYTSLIDSLDIGGTKASSLLDEVDLAFKKYSLGKAGLTGVPETVNLSTGALMLDLQKATGTFMWELLLERLEILRSNVFSYFSIITHDNDNSESKLNGSGAKSNGFNSAAQLTDAYMDKAVPACLSHLFEKLSPSFDSDTMRIDQSRLHDYAAIVGYYNAMRAEFPALSKIFINDIRVSVFSEFQSPTDGVTIGKNPATYYSVRGEVRRAIVDEFVSMYFKNSPNLSCLKIPQIFANINEQWAITMGQMDATRIDRSNVSGTPDDHPLRNYPNKARDVISSTVLTRMGTTADAADVVFGAVCKIVYANYHADGAFSSLIVNKQDTFHQMNKARFVRRYYRSVSNPIAISSTFIADYDVGVFEEEKAENDALLVSNRTRGKTSEEFTTSYNDFIKTHPLLTSPEWISTPLPTYTAFTADAVGTYAALFKIKRGALGSLTRKPESKHAHASHPAATNQKKQPPGQQRQPPPHPGTAQPRPQTSRF
jgi:hypothetical protein